MSFYDDKVELRVAGTTINITKDYEVNASVIEQPARFDLSLGRAEQFSELRELLGKGGKFQLIVNDLVFQTGELDGISNSSGDRTIPVTGACLLKELAANHIRSERHFSESTYTDLTVAGMQDCGISALVFASNDANLKAITGYDIVAVNAEIKEPELDADGNAVEVTETDPVKGETKKTYRTIKAKLGTPWITFLARQYQRDGLFLWSAGDGNLVLAKPNPFRAPVASLWRKMIEPAADGRPAKFAGNIIGHRWVDQRSGRYTECIVYTGDAKGKKVFAKAVDFEMVQYLNREYYPEITLDQYNDDKFYCRRRRLVVHDKTARTVDRCQAIADRKLAETRRAGWKLQYQVVGHSIIGVNGQRMNWAHDIVINVNDDEIGFYGSLYVDTVKLAESMGTGRDCWLGVMRPGDMAFAIGDAES